ncbi:MAG: fasciclin domain-containing protein [Granulosicoccus sp.]
MKKFGKLLALGSLCIGLVACSDSEVEVLPSDDATQILAQAGDGSANIVDTAVAAGSFNTLAAALQATGLDAVLADEARSFTVFAPTDRAFDALGQETIDALLNDTDTLSDILLYHVIADATVDAATATTLAGQTVTMANSDDVALSLDGMRLFINSSEVIVTDIAATNGIIHVIDAVLTPPADMPDANDAPLANIVDTAIAAGNFTTLATALEATDLISVLGDESREFTVFAPTDDAFAALGTQAINDLLADPETLRDILLYHVIADASIDASTAISLAGSTATTANGDEIALSLNEGNLFINMSQVITTDIITSNGIIHVIDAVLTPPADVQEQALVSIVDTAIAAGSFNTLVTALQVTGLDSTLANTNDTFTVFAPTDDAFAKLGEDTINALLADPETLSNILLYHVIGGQAVDSTTAISLSGSSVATANGDTVAISLDGDRLLINQSEVIIADVNASNGIIHAIDTVLIPPAGMPTDTPPQTVAESGTLLDVAKAAGNFTTLVAALEATGLDGAIGHSGDLYTVFAPTDAAFAQLGQDTINALLADPATLRNILLYHVIPGTVVDSTTALSLVGTSIEAGNGDRFELRLDGSSLFINDSLITATDIRGVNGIIHVIDTVLTPPHGT